MEWWLGGVWVHLQVWISHGILGHDGVALLLFRLNALSTTPLVQHSCMAIATLPWRLSTVACLTPKCLMGCFSVQIYTVLMFRCQGICVSLRVEYGGLDVVKLFQFSKDSHEHLVFPWNALGSFYWKTQFSSWNLECPSGYYNFVHNPVRVSASSCVFKLGMNSWFSLSLIIILMMLTVWCWYCRSWRVSILLQWL